MSASAESQGPAAIAVSQPGMPNQAIQPARSRFVAKGRAVRDCLMCSEGNHENRKT
jgi:hypothetical protein